MCVIIVKRAGAKMPKYNELKSASICHPHGCGFVSTSGKHFKGLDFEDFYKHLKTVGRDEACIIHFRFATHGPVNKSNCHPFEHGGVWFAHNGILDITPIKGKTDSETAFLKYIYPTIHDYGLDSIETETIIEDIIGGSKFAIMCDGKIRIYGHFIEENGILYSNTRHKYYYQPYIENKGHFTYRGWSF